MSKKFKIASLGSVAGLVLALGIAAAPAQAVTVAELQAQINLLMSQLAALQGGSTVSAGTTFTQDMTVGSTGAQVVALQQMLVAGGYLTMPTGVAYGYFGTLTKTAVAKWQAASGVPATGYFGPLSRAKANATSGTTVGGTVGSTTGGTTVSGSISTPGAEGTMTVTSAPVSTSNYYEGDSKDAVLAFNVKAQGSDLAVQRVKLDLGTDSDVYRNAFSNVYVVDDAGNVVASSALNSNTVVKDGSNYYVTLTGFSSIVKKDNTRTYTVKMDVNSSVDSADNGPFTIKLADNGVRAIDGAGIDLYAPTTSTISHSVSISDDLAESATLTVSKDSASPVTREVIAASGSASNEADKQAVLTFDLRAEKDMVKVTDIAASTTVSGGTATIPTIYLIAGNSTSGSVIASATASSGTVTFSDVDLSIAKDSTQTYTIAVDIRTAGTAQSTISATVPSTGITAENSLGDDVTVSGSATSASLLVRNAGAQLSLASKSISKTSNDTNSTATGSFDIVINAVGGDVVASSTAAVVYSVLENNVATSTSQSGFYTVPTNCGTNDGTNWTITKGSSCTITVKTSYTVPVGYPAKYYAFQITNVKANNASITYMANDTAWRTEAVLLP